MKLTGIADEAGEESTPVVVPIVVQHWHHHPNVPTTLCTFGSKTDAPKQD